MGIEEVVTAPRSPWQNPYVERVIGSIRRECLDHLIVVDERHLRRILASYFDYYHRSRTHLSLCKDSPIPRPVESAKAGEVIALPQVGGLHHPYDATGCLNAGLLTTTGSNRIAPLARSVPVAGKRRFVGLPCCMAVGQCRIFLSCHRICSPPLKRGHKIRVISAQIEFLGGTPLSIAAELRECSHFEADARSFFSMTLFNSRSCDMVFNSSFFAK